MKSINISRNSILLIVLLLTIFCIIKVDQFKPDGNSYISYNWHVSQIGSTAHYYKDTYFDENNRENIKRALESYIILTGDRLLKFNGTTSITNIKDLLSKLQKNINFNGEVDEFLVSPEILVDNWCTPASSNIFGEKLFWQIIVNTDSGTVDVLYSDKYSLSFIDKYNTELFLKTISSRNSTRIYQISTFAILFLINILLLGNLFCLYNHSNKLMLREYLVGIGTSLIFSMFLSLSFDIIKAAHSFTFFFGIISVITVIAIFVIMYYKVHLLRKFSVYKRTVKSFFISESLIVIIYFVVLLIRFKQVTGDIIF